MDTYAVDTYAGNTYAVDTYASNTYAVDTYAVDIYAGNTYAVDTYAGLFLIGWYKSKLMFIVFVALFSSNTCASRSRT